MNRYLIAAVIACLLIMWGGWQKIRNKDLQLEQQAGEIESLNKAADSRRNTQRLLADLDTQHTKALSDAQATNSQLRADVAAGSKRLSVLAKCPAVRSTTAGTSLGDAEARAELNPAAAERIVRIANDGDEAIHQLSALQDYVRTACQGEAR
ncbi:lysis protein [Pseudomonas protegens]|uniref:lysis protein n=1 Tax=Pseudomonas protegens TaxID=380021 RepID=UPI0003752A69|nr:lysis protein [Pseudomonas protegens]ROM29285.1 lysis protein [Pseudomonas protegens]ROM36917.1 lysis protein [Pseudomonas protegens]